MTFCKTIRWGAAGFLEKENRPRQRTLLGCNSVCAYSAWNLILEDSLRFMMMKQGRPESHGGVSDITGDNTWNGRAANGFTNRRW
jgi:hypothetical protein